MLLPTIHCNHVLFVKQLSFLNLFLSIIKTFLKKQEFNN